MKRFVGDTSGEDRNQYRFLSFSERLAQVNVDIFRNKTRHTNIPLDGLETYFKREVDAWFDRTQNDSFMELYEFLRPKIISLPMILHQLETIVNKMNEMLEKEDLDSDTAQAILSLLGILSRDMRSEFYPLFPSVLRRLVHKIDSWRTDSDLLEKLFESLSYMFKYLQKNLVKDLKNVFDFFVDFFDNPKQYVREFASESFSFLVRKVPEDEIFDHIHHFAAQLDADQRVDSENLIDGLSLLFFHTVRGTKVHLNSSLSVMMQAYLAEMTAAAAESDEKAARRYQVNLGLMQRMRKHLVNAESEELWNLLQSALEQVLGNKSSTARALQAQLIAKLMSEWTRSRYNSTKTKADSLIVSCNRMQKAIFTMGQSIDVATAAPKYFAAMLELLSILLKTLNHLETHGTKFVAADAAKSQDIVIEKLFEVAKGQQDLVIPFLRFISDLSDLSKFGSLFLAPSFRFIDWHLADKTKQDKFGLLALEFWRRVCGGIDWTSASGPHVRREVAHLIPSTSNITDYALKTLVKNLDPLLARSGNDDNADSTDELVSLIWTATEVINHIESSKIEATAAALKDASSKVFHQLSTLQSRQNPRFFFRLQFVLSELLQSEILLYHTSTNDMARKTKDAALVGLFDRVLDASRAHEKSVFILRSFRLMLQSITAKQDAASADSAPSTVIATLSADSGIAERISQLQEKLHENLSHKSHSLRSVTIAVLALLNKLPSSSTSNTTFNYTADLLEEMQEIEDAALNPLESRSISVRIHRLKEILIHQSPLTQQQEQKENKKKRSTSDTPNTMSSEANAADRQANADRDIVLRYLFGIFYKKLVLLWPMTKEILFFLAAQDYRRYWRILWPLFQSAIHRSPQQVALEKALDESDYPVQFDVDNDDASDYSVENLSALGQGASGGFGKALKLDAASTEALAYSKQLWECVCQMHKLTQHSAAEFRPLIDMFIAFIREKYPHLQSQQHSSKKTTAELEISHFMDRSSKALLTEFLKFFSQFRLPSTNSALAQKIGYSGSALTTRGHQGTITAQPHLHHEDELFEIFVLLLTHGNETIQRLALDCIMLWKLEFLLPYRENLQRLCSSKDLREAITAWRIGKAAGEIQPQHRIKVAEYIINLIYPKLVAKGRHAVMLSNRRTAILSFLSSLEPEELKPLIQLLFRSFNPIFEAKTREKRIEAAMAIDWKKQVGVLSLLEDLIKQMGKNLQAYLSQVIPLVLALLQSAIAMRKTQLSQADDDASDEENAVEPEAVEEVETPSKKKQKKGSKKPALDAMDEDDADEAPPVVPSSSQSTPDKDALAKIRKLAIRRLGQIMRDYKAYDFSLYDKEILHIIDSEVEKLHQQVSNEKAGSVLDLALILSRHSRTVIFLKPSLKTILSCLTLPNVSFPVRSELYSLLDNLLRLRDLQAPESDAMDVDDSAPSEPIDLVRPHVDLLLEAFKVRFSTDYGQRRRKIGQRELTLVERLSPYATSTVAADQLIGLLMPFLRMKGIQLTAREHILTIFRNLAPLLTSPMNWAPTIARLFMSFPTRASRDAVCGVYEQLASVDPVLKEIAPLLTDMNSWVVSRATEEPDYDRRFAAYQKINEELMPSLSDIQLLPIIYNYLFFMSNADLSLRSNASHGLAKFIQLVAGSQKKKIDPRVASLLPDIVLPAIKKNLDHETMATRAEYVDLFRTLLVANPAMYPDLAALMGDNPEDESTNFFLTVLHLQMHRRQKAIHMFVDVMRSGSIQFSTDSLMNILFPIFKSAVLEATVRQHNYVDDLINAIAAIARVVDWSKYSRIIQTFVDAMPKLATIENQLVKLVVKVLDEFHFDISKDFSPKAVAAAAAKFSVEKPVTAEVKELFAAEVAAAKVGEEPEDGEGDTAPVAAPKKDEMDVDEVAEGEEKPSDTSVVPPEPAVEAAEEEEDEEEEKEEPADDQMDVESDADRLQKTIQHHLLNRLLPTLHDRLKESKGSHTVRAPVALAIIKLLQLMPNTISEFQVARLLTRLCAELSSRAQANRDSCRDTLKQILVKLGAKYFSFVLQMMEANLIRGYQLHVLSYSVHDLLRTLVPLYKPGEIDAAVPHVQKILFQDMLGVAEEQRSEAKIQHSMKETKKSYSLDSFQLLSQAVDFQSSSMTLIGPIRDTLLGSGQSLTEENSIMKQSDVALIKKMSDILDQIVIGLKANSSVKAQDLFIFCFLMIKENMDSQASAAAADEAAAENAPKYKKDDKTKPYRKLRMKMDPKKEAKFLVAPDPRKMRSQIEAVIAGNEHIMAVFALQILHTFLKAAEQPGQSPINRKDPEHIAMIDPFVKLLFKCMTSRHDRLLVMSLKVLCQIIKIQNMPTVKSKCQAIGKRAIALMQKANPHSELLQMSFKTLTTLYREVKTFELGEHHLGIAMNFLRTALETLDNPNLVFSLFKSLVWRRVLHPTIYDMIPQLNEMLVQTASQSVRSHCEGIMMQFLITYPLGEKRLQQHLDALMANVNYDYEPGRLALLNVLSSIFSRFPQEVIQTRLEYFVLPLVAQMINDDSKQCRAKAADVISSIIKAVDVDHKLKLLNMTTTWLAPSDSEMTAEERRKKFALQLAAVRLVPLFVPHYAMAGGDQFDKFVSKVLPLMKQILLDSDLEELDDMDNELEGDIYDSSIGWQLMYLTLIALEKIVQHQSRISGRKDFIPILEWVSQRLLHQHVWIRLVSSRIIGAYFGHRHEMKNIEPKLKQREAASKKGVKRGAVDEEDDFLLRPRTLFNLAKSFCKQLESEFLTPELGTQIVKNLLFASTNLLRFPALTPAHVDDITEISDDEEEDEAVAADEDAPESNTDDEDEEMDGQEGGGQEAKKRVGLPPMEWIFRRLSYMARKDGTVKRTAIFQFFAAISLQLTQEELSSEPRAFLMPMINPLFRIKENDEIKDDDPQLGALKQLSGEVLDLIKKRAGSAAFLAAYEVVRRSVSRIRGERKQARKILAIADPRRHAQQRLRKHKRQRESKKRKIDEYKVNRTRLKVRKME